MMVGVEGARARRKSEEGSRRREREGDQEEVGGRGGEGCGKEQTSFLSTVMQPYP